jgi:hypothetical protein
MAQVIALGGSGAKRYFAPAAETTARQDGWLMVQVADAGIAKAIGKGLKDETESLSVVIEILRSGKWEYLLAGILVERDVPWTPETAEANAEWFAGLTDPESKQAIRDNLMPLLAAFFLNAPLSSMPSPNASTKTGSRKASHRPKSGAERSIKRKAPVLADSGATAPES